MKGLGTILLLAIVGVTAAGVWYWIHRPALAHIAIAVDGSDSVTQNCKGVVSAYSVIVAKQHGFRNGSMVSVLTMGRSRMDMHPRLQAQAAIPFPSDDVYGVDHEAEERRKREFEQQLEHSCEAAHGAADSPIYEMIRQALAQLRSESIGCAPDGNCHLLVKSDLDEDVNAPLKQMLDALRVKPDAMLPDALVGSLDNAGITVTICGYSEVRPRASGGLPAPSQDALLRTWQALFRDPESVNLQPYCQ